MHCVAIFCPTTLDRVNLIFFKTALAQVLAAAGADGIVTIWNLTSLKSPECIRILHHSGSRVMACTFSGCGTLLASGDDQGLCRLFDVRGWNPLNCNALSPVQPTEDWGVTHELVGHHGTERAISCLSFSSDSQMLASASMDTTVRVWKHCVDPPHAGQWVSSYCIHFPGPVNFIQFAPYGLQVVANCLNDDRAYIWDIESMIQQQDPWVYEVLDCGDDKDEIACTSAAWCAFFPELLNFFVLFCWHAEYVARRTCCHVSDMLSCVVR